MALNLGELFGTIGLDSSEWDTKLAGAQDSLKTFGVAGAAIGLAGAAAIGAAITKGISDNLDIEAGTDKLQASLGLTAEEAERAGAAAGSVYAQNFGESMEAAQVGVEAVMSSISGMREASQADVEDMTKRMLTLSDTMGIDVARAAQVAGQMMTTGLAKDGVHAADLLTKAMQDVPVNVREDILDAADEYGPFFANLGIDGEKAMGMLVAASETGMYGIDKTGDALKEFGIRATDMSKASAVAYEEIGMSQEDMTNKLLAGGETASGAFQDIVKGIQGIKNPADQSAAAIALFGTPLEDLSVTEIPAFLDSLSSAGGGLDDVAGASDMAMTDVASNAKAGFESFKRQAEAGLIEVVNFAIMPAVTAFADYLSTQVGPAIQVAADWITNEMMPALQGFGDWFTENQDAIGIWAGIIGAVMLPVFVRIAVAAGLSAAAQVVAWASAAGGAVKTAAVYVAQSYVMIGRFVAMTAAAVAHGIAVAAVWTGTIIRNLVVGAATYVAQAAIIIGRWVAMSAAAVVNGLRMAAVWTAQVVASAVVGAASFAVQAARVVGGWLLMGTQSLIHAARMAAAWFIALGPIGWVIAAVIGLVALIIANWDKVVSFTTDAWSNVTGFISDAFQNMLAFAHQFGSNISGFLGDTWQGLIDGVSGFVDNALQFFRDLPGQIQGIVSGAGRWLWDAGKNIVQGLMDGIGSLAGSIGSFFLNLLPGWIREPFKAALGIHSPSREFMGYGENIGEGLMEGVEHMARPIEDQMAGLVGIPEVPGVDVGSSSFGAGVTAAGNPYTTQGMDGGGVRISVHVTEASNARETAQLVTSKIGHQFSAQGVNIGDIDFD